MTTECGRGPCWKGNGHDGPCEPGSTRDPRRAADQDAHRSRLVTHYLAPLGHFVHALPDGFGACNANRDPAKVDCDICLSILGVTS